MRYDIPKIAEQVANKIIGMVDAEPYHYVDDDFNDPGIQDGLVQEQVQWFLDYKGMEPSYDWMVEQLIEHPIMQQCFGELEVIIKDYKRDLIYAESERRMLEMDYRRSVL